MDGFDSRHLHLKDADLSNIREVGVFYVTYMSRRGVLCLSFRRGTMQELNRPSFDVRCEVRTVWSSPVLCVSASCVGRDRGTSTSSDRWRVGLGVRSSLLFWLWDRRSSH